MNKETTQPRFSALRVVVLLVGVLATIVGVAFFGLPGLIGGLGFLILVGLAK